MAEMKTVFTAESKRERDKLTDELKDRGVTDVFFQDLLEIVRLNEGAHICVGRRFEYTRHDKVEYGGGGNCIHITDDELRDLIKSLEAV